MVWDFGIPGKESTGWAGGLFKLRMIFPNDYPQKPPHCIFTPPLFHPNVYQDGEVCLSIINESIDWKPAITIKQIVLGIQSLLNEPNPNSPANEPAFKLFMKDRRGYDKRILAQSAANKPSV